MLSYIAAVVQDSLDNLPSITTTQLLPAIELLWGTSGSTPLVCAAVAYGCCALVEPRFIKHTGISFSFPISAMGLECSALKQMVSPSTAKSKALSNSCQYLKSAGAEGSIDGAAHHDLTLSYIDADSSSSPTKQPEKEVPPTKTDEVCIRNPEFTNGTAKSNGTCPTSTSTPASSTIQITWSPEPDVSWPTTVFVAGNFNQWSADSHKMDLKDGRFTISVPRTKIKSEKIEFKFVADGVWKASGQYEQCADGMGGVNNCITV